MFNFKIVLIFLITSISSVCSCEYENQITESTREATRLLESGNIYYLKEDTISLNEGISNLCVSFPMDVFSALDQVDELLVPGGKALFFFYPKRCGFDRIAFSNKEFFISMGEFKQRAKGLGFRCNYSAFHRQLAKFEDLGTLDHFMQKNFQTNVDIEVFENCIKKNISFPTKYAVVLLEKS